jgi:hypothetical protein
MVDASSRMDQPQQPAVKRLAGVPTGTILITDANPWRMHKGNRSMATKGATAELTRSSAHIFVSGRGENSVVRVLAPGKLSAGQIEKINKVLIEDVIKGITGCACLSGVIDVIFDRGFEKSINVHF